MQCGGGKQPIIEENAQHKVQVTRLAMEVRSGRFDKEVEDIMGQVRQGSQERPWRSGLVKLDKETKRNHGGQGLVRLNKDNKRGHRGQCWSG